jgi:hypothetical protein
MLASFLSQPVVFGTSVSEVLMDVTLLGLVGGLYRHVECNQESCHRLGRFRHGHLKLCHVHHPLVPDDGHVTAEHIAAVTKHT